MGVLGVLLGTLMAGNTQVVVPMGRQPGLAVQIAARKGEHKERGVFLWEEAQIWRALTGQEMARAGTVAGIEELREDADQHEGHFDTGTATELRQSALKSFQLTPRPSLAMRALVARVTHDLSAGWLNEGDLEKAREFALYSIVHFGSHEVDPRRHAPRVVEFFEARRSEVSAARGAILKLRVERPGTLYIDGDPVAGVEEEWSGRLPPGDYRLWIKGSSGWSLPYSLTMGAQEQEVVISNAYDHCWVLVPTVRFVCGVESVLAGAGFASRLGVDELTLLRITEDNQVEEYRFKRGEEMRSEVSPLVGVAELGVSIAIPTSPSVEAHRYLPFGVGQFVQGRVLAGALLLGAQVGLIAWNLSSAQRYNDLESRRMYNDTEDARYWQNVSASLVYTGLIAGVMEAFLHDPER